MHRPALVCMLCLSLFLAGCGSLPIGGGTGGTEFHDSCDSSAATSSKTLPEKPSAFTESAILDYVEDYESVLLHNQAVNGSDDAVEFIPSSAEIHDRTAEGYVIQVDSGYTIWSCSDWSGHGDAGAITAYYINRTTLVRLDNPATTPTDPRGDGTVVERWATPIS